MSGTEKTERPSKVDLDTILVEEIGQFGKFQIRTLCLTLIAVVFSAFHAEYVFTTGRISSRCLIPECENSSTAVYSPEWILNAVPATKTGFDNCNRYGNRSVSVNATDICPADLFDTNTVVACDQYVYENQLTVVYDYDLACDERRRTLIGFVRTFGSLGALPITGYISDRWGRRVALALNAFNTSWVGLARYWANTYLGYIISQFMETVLGGGVFSCTFILVQELVGPEYRTIAGAILTTGFAVGQVLMGFIAWGVPAWRPLTLTLYIPQFITVIYFWLLPESVRWLMSKGRYAESEAILKGVARVNGKVLSDKSLEALRSTAEEEKKIQQIEKEIKKTEPWLIVLVFQHKRILLRCLVSPMWWITTTLVYYGLTINAVNMFGNSYLNYVAVAAAEIPGFWLSVLLIDRVGRKPVLISGFWMCAICQVGYIFMPNNMYALSLTVYVIGKIAIATVVTAIYMYTTEIYPTRYRHNLFAFSSMIGRIGSIAAPLTPAIGASTIEELPFILFASFSLVSGALVFLTPETLGSKLPDTLEEASAIGLKKK